MRIWDQIWGRSWRCSCTPSPSSCPKYREIPMALYLRWPLLLNHICINYSVLRVNIRYSIGLRRLLRTKWLEGKRPLFTALSSCSQQAKKVLSNSPGLVKFFRGIHITNKPCLILHIKTFFSGWIKIMTLGLVLASYSLHNRQAVTLKLTFFALWFNPPTPPPLLPSRKAWY